MIINSNALNIDTNTQRTNAEINALIDAKLSNVSKKELLYSTNVNGTYSHGQTIGSFSLNRSRLFDFSALLCVFDGTFSIYMPSGSGGGSIRLKVGTKDATVSEINANAGRTSSLGHSEVILIGGYPIATNEGSINSTIYKRWFMDFYGNVLTFEDNFSGSFIASLYNSAVNVTVSGSIMLYGIK